VIHQRLAAICDDELSQEVPRCYTVWIESMHHYVPPASPGACCLPAAAAVVVETSYGGVLFAVGRAVAETSSDAPRFRRTLLVLQFVSDLGV